ncbi:MAG TPA: HisA/HisF-related TIM barrel protein [Anaerolineaceae bacterium]|nr:HisA/HisF-related TIM barrel protein [Anaerolineaceae bacterium]
MSVAFTIFPAIDLRRGQVVRLQMGDPVRQTTYSSDPAAAARRWIASGARWLHLVNLDGAFGEGDRANLLALEGVVHEAAAGGARVQFGGGLRSREGLRRAIDLGIARVVLGTAAIEQPDLLAWALDTWGPERVAVSIDAQDGWVRVHGWAESSGLRDLDLALTLAGQGLEWLVFTDIARDGLGRGLNLVRTADLAQASRLNVIASGGVHSLADVDGARAAGLSGVIVGRALYDGSIDPKQLFSPKKSQRTENREQGAVQE